MASNNKKLDDDDAEEDEETEENSNPFSFKTFLNNKNSTTDNTSQTNTLSFKHFINNETLPSQKFIPPPPSPPLLSPPPPPPKLPDFVNESLLLLNNDVNNHKISVNNNENPYQFLESIPKLTDKLKKEETFFENRNPVSSYFDLETQINDASCEIPFISTLNDIPNTVLHQSEVPSDNLKRKLKEKQSIINEQSNHIKQLEKTIKDLKKKEANENQALESIVQQVEKNLVKTTERAVESERNNEKLRQEIKQLKAENQLLKSLKKDENKISSFAAQINSAATQAETSLKQLLTGVDTLRLIAASIESYDKIKEIPNEKD
jgi:DNA repair exonuclease SbcCD ATPase subunit